MGWFWADSVVAPTTMQTVSIRASSEIAASPPPNGCPMHQKAADPSPSGCPVVPHSRREQHEPASTDPHGTSESSPSLLSQLNPLNYMPRHTSQAPALNQTHLLPTSREASTIPRGAHGKEDGIWEYPSPQQMYNALLRKGYADTDITAVEEMVAVHNFLNEGAWAEIVGWERRFRGGLLKGAQICRRGEENSEEMIWRTRDGFEVEPRLVRFQGRPGEMTPRAFLLQALGRIYPAKYATEPPFDRHDWYVSRTTQGRSKQVRYVIDYYAGPPEPTGEPVFYLDIRPAATLTGAAERFIRWGGDVWWRASGGVTREQK